MRRTIMTTTTTSPRAHLWAVGYDDMDRASQVREDINSLAGPQQYLFLLDVLVVVRGEDGAYTVDREHGHPIRDIVSTGILGGLVGVILAVPPLSAAAVGAMFGSAAAAASAVALIDKAFIEQIESLMKPGTSALFVLDDGADMDVIAHQLRGSGGTVLKTNVDLERARLVQSILSNEAVRN